MRRLSRPWLVLLLCLATVFNGVAAAATMPVAQAAAPCEMGAGHEGTHDSPCGDCGDSSAVCVQQCAAMSAGVLVAQPRFPLGVNIPSQRVAVSAAALFDSHAASPGFQPPR